PYTIKHYFLMIRRPPRSTRKESSAASDVYKRQIKKFMCIAIFSSRRRHTRSLSVSWARRCV
ncbi:hypothetical protein, partial [Staphylococcus aureus]